MLLTFLWSCDWNDVFTDDNSILYRISKRSHIPIHFNIFSQDKYFQLADYFLESCTIIPTAGTGFDCYRSSSGNGEIYFEINFDYHGKSLVMRKISAVLLQYLAKVMGARNCVQGWGWFLDPMQLSTVFLLKIFMSNTVRYQQEIEEILKS